MKSRFEGTHVTAKQKVAHVECIIYASSPKLLLKFLPPLASVMRPHYLGQQESKILCIRHESTEEYANVDIIPFRMFQNINNTTLNRETTATPPVPFPSPNLCPAKHICN